MSIEPATSIVEDECYHVASGDSPFTARMRFHQSWYRRHVLQLPPGANRAARGNLYGNVLQESDGQRGLNFLNEGIHAVARERLARSGAVEPDRLLNNLLSSQPMCFNLFGHLSRDLDLATTLFSALPRPGRIRVTDVRLEYAPDPDSHLADRTAFDAWVEYDREGGRGFIGIETKLTEPFSQISYDKEKPGYSRWLRMPNTWWEPGTDQHFGEKEYNQIWRNHLLAFAILNQPGSKYTEGFCAVVHHDLDNGCATAVANYATHLSATGRSTLLTWQLGDLVSRWTSNSMRRADWDWITQFRLRYLGLEASEPAWNLFRSRMDR